jgi:molybdopterin converting factor small subunit
MKITVQLFAKARELAGAERIDLDLPVAGRVADLKRLLVERFPRVAPLVSSLLVAVGTDYADDSTVITQDCLVSCFPPVSGG